MANEGFKRKLTSIFSADAVGYSRLMEDDEEATVRTLTSYREVIARLSNSTTALLWILQVTIYWLSSSVWLMRFSLRYQSKTKSMLATKIYPKTAKWSFE